MQDTNENFSFKKYAWAQFKKNKIALVSLYLLLILVIIALFAPYIANDRPLYAEYEGNTLYPAFASDTRTDSIYMKFLGQPLHKVNQQLSNQPLLKIRIK